MRIFIEPTEPLMFRTGRPFDAGESNFAESLFPPTPETLQGALRATIATHWNPAIGLAAAFEDPDLTKLIGNRDSYGRFRITGISLGKYDNSDPEKIERLFPSPAHIVHDDEGILRLTPKPIGDGENVYSNLPDDLRHILLPEKTTKGKLKPLEGWLSEESLKKTLRPNKDLTDIQVVSSRDIYTQEPRLGIGIQKGTKATQTGFLYQVQMIRMEPRYGFVVDIHLATLSSNEAPIDETLIQKKLNLPKEGWLTLGGEQRAGHFRVLPHTAESRVETLKERTLVYLATPASFTTGWKPSQAFVPLDKPFAAAVNRYEPIGGWKLNPGDAKGESKTTRRCVPAGSVYFFDRTVNVTQPLTDYGMEIGYGITYTGEW